MILYSYQLIHSYIKNISYKKIKTIFVFELNPQEQ
jgi:hypothetical protein